MPYLKPGLLNPIMYSTEALLQSHVSGNTDRPRDGYFSCCVAISGTATGGPALIRPGCAVGVCPVLSPNPPYPSFKDKSELGVNMVSEL